VDQVSEAFDADLTVRRHLAAMIVIAQDGEDSDVARLARSEICRLAAAICAALSMHRLHPSGFCGACGRTVCALRGSVRRALLPVRLPGATSGEGTVVDWLN
jgi:hypothetical protein